MQQTSLEPVPFQHVRISDGFWKRRIDINREVTARVCIEQCEITHRIDNFRVAAGRKPGKFEGIYYNDSDIYKVLEGIAYMLMDRADPSLEKTADEIIDDICAAQQEDGYLYTFYTLNTPEYRWTDMSFHEAYCLGHMIEGAVAYDRATGKDKWLKAAIRAVRQMMSVIGPGKKHWVTGHEEIELALVLLYRHTGDESFLDFAQWLVDERGHGHLSTPLYAHKDFFKPEYCQDDVPARQLSRVTGHAVRAMYYYSALADLAALKDDKELLAALLRLWSNVIPGNYYITGGIGQSAYNEGFTRDWSLPNLTAYCETCAAIGMALWNHRMNLLTHEAKYADVVETEMYNGILSGVSLPGDRFFYVNPLSSAGTHHRRPWYGTSCCPTNIIRFLPSVGGYAYAIGEEGVYINQYLPGSADIPTKAGNVKLLTETNYPWDGQVAIQVEESPDAIDLMLRIPGWCKDYTLTVNGTPVSPILEKGYAWLSVKARDRVELLFVMPVRREYADPRVAEDKGRVAVARGPVIYCAEEVDNPGIVSEYFPAEKTLSASAQTKLIKVNDLPVDTVALNIGGVTMIPYCLWDNRSAGAMAVWLKENP